jgi:hypothetical protein
MLTSSAAAVAMSSNMLGRHGIGDAIISSICTANEAAEACSKAAAVYHIAAAAWRVGDGDWVVCAWTCVEYFVSLYQSVGIFLSFPFLICNKSCF